MHVRLGIVSLYFPFRLVAVAQIGWVLAGLIGCSDGGSSTSSGGVPRMVATPEFSPGELSAGDAVEITVETSGTDDSSNVFVFLIDRLRTDVLREAFVTGVSQFLSSTDGTTWTAEYPLSEVAVTDDYTLEVYVLDEDFENGAAYLYYSPTSDSSYVELTRENGEYSDPEVSNVRLGTVSLEALPGRTEYSVWLQAWDSDSDPYLEISPSTESPDYTTHSENDEPSLSEEDVADSRFVVALESGQSYYIRAIDAFDTGGGYRINFSESTSIGGEFGEGGADSYEDDDDADSATEIVLEEDAQPHTFFPVGETDWFVITAP